MLVQRGGGAPLDAASERPAAMCTIETAQFGREASVGWGSEAGLDPRAPVHRCHQSVESERVGAVNAGSYMHVTRFHKLSGGGQSSCEIASRTMLRYNKRTVG